MELSVMELVEFLAPESKKGLPPESSLLNVDINTDTRTLKNGQTFWALKGENFDGHNYIEKAFENGCVTCVVNHSWREKNQSISGFCVPVEDTYQALLDLGAHYAEKFSFPVVAVTGSNGKTTTKEMLDVVLEKKGNVLSTKGNFNNHIGVPLTLFRFQSSHHYAVVEMGTNHPGEIATLSQTVKPDVCVITSIGHSHREFFNSLDDVLKEKLSIIKGMKKGGTLYINADDEHLGTIKPSTYLNVKTVGIEKGDLQAENVNFDVEGCAQFTVEGSSYRLKVPGKHNIYNALLAISVGSHFGVEASKMSLALESFCAPKHRMEIKKIKGITLIDDTYNANPNSTSSALGVLSSIQSTGRKIAVLGEMGEIGNEGPELHQKIGSDVAMFKIDECMSLGKGAFEINRGAQKAGMPQSALSQFEISEELVKNLIPKISKGDVVLFKGSRFLRMEKIVASVEEFLNHES